jgi:hypothetical protein
MRMPQMTATSIRGGVLALLFKLRGRSISAGDTESIHRLVASLGKLKGVAMKMGQHLSYVDTSIPDEVRAALAALQTHSQPMSMTRVTKIIRDELGAKASALIDSMDPLPIASASIGQVHRARLPNGTAVAVKVQHPGVLESIDSDFGPASVAARLASWVYPSAQIDDFVREARARVLDECDYRAEARHQITLAAKLAGHPTLVIPTVHPAYCSDRVLTTDLIEGIHPDEFLASDPSEEQRSQLGNALFEFYVGSLLKWNILSGDPHPGNYLRCADGRIAIIDHGCTRTLGADGERRGAIVRVFDAPDRPSAYKAIAALGSDSLLLLRIRFGLESMLARLGTRTTWRDLFRTCVSGVVRSDPSLASVFASEAPGVVPMAYEVVLRDAGTRVIEVVRHVRELTGAGIGDAKQLVDNPPCVLLRTSERAKANELERRLADSGANVEIHEVPLSN